MKYPLLAFLLMSFTCAHAFEWQVKRHEGRDYVPVSDIAKYYDFPEQGNQVGKSILFQNGIRNLSFTLDSREAIINDVKHWMAFPVSQMEGKYWVSRLDVGKTIDPALLPQNIKGFQPMNTVVIDAGHGGQDKGAFGKVAYEKDFTLDVARRVRDRLKRAGLRVIMTRNSDATVELHDRARMASEQTNAVFISIHFNAAPNTDARGFEIFCVTPRGSPSTEYDQLTVRDMVMETGNENDMLSFGLANSIYHSMHGNMNMMDRGVKRARFAVLRLTGIPSVLIEGGFLTNQRDLRNVASKEWREKYASAIATGIIAYKNLCEKSIAPKISSQYRQPQLQPAVMVDLKNVPIQKN